MVLTFYILQYLYEFGIYFEETYCNMLLRVINGKVLSVIKVFTPTDAQVFFFFKGVQQTSTSKDLIIYAATPPD